MGTEPDEGDGRGSDVLAQPDRLDALRDSGLTAVADPVLDGIAERVRRLLGVPVALVSLVDPDGQSFPGQAGLAPPWSQRRRTPLSHSFCRQVVVSAAPFVVTDARTATPEPDAGVRELGIVAYAGIPLLDGTGEVLGSLCAIDHEPRSWSAAELDLLAGLADGCAAEFRVRLARADAARERARRDAVERDLSASYQRSQSLLRASQAFTDATGLADTRRRLADLVSITLRPASVRIAVLDDDRTAYRLHDGATATPREGTDLPWTDRGVDGGAARELLTVVGDGAEPDDGFPSGFRTWLARQGMSVALVVRLLGRDGELGLMVLGWSTAPRLDDADRLYATTIAGYVSQAVARARFVERRVNVAHEMQAAMLAPLPAVPGVEIVARYRPADDHEDVGGDWYDVSLLPDPDPDAAEPVIAASVGDVVGHTLDSAVRMGQVRSMLRQAAWDVGDGPASALVATERAIAGDDLGHAGTAVLVHLRRCPDGWALTWTNAGHPVPLVIDGDGTVRALEGLDPLFGYPVALRRPRADHRAELHDGDTLVLYTDGLVERAGEDLDEGHRRLQAALTRHADLKLDDLVDASIADVDPAATDDVALLAIRLGPQEA